MATDAVTLEVRWNRDDSVEGAVRRGAGDVRTVTLRPNERHVVDLVRMTGTTVANLVLEVAATRAEDPALADAVLGYDLWLVHDTAAGTRTTRRLTRSGRPGEEVAFAFDPLAFSVDAAQPIDGATGPLKMTFQGVISGRPRPDGSLEVALRSERRMMVSRPGTVPGTPAGASGGVKAFVVKAGETTGIEFPIPADVFGWKFDDPVPARFRPGATGTADGAVRVATAQFFAGSRTMILITVRRER
jgi:hypothetical protein